MPDHHDLVRNLAELPVAEFVELMRLTFDARSGDLDSPDVSGHYVLATVTMTAGEREVQFVAYPRDPLVGDGLWEGGFCSACGREATSTAKRALCGVCSAEIGLT